MKSVDGVADDTPSMLSPSTQILSNAADDSGFPSSDSNTRSSSGERTSQSGLRELEHPLCSPIRKIQAGEGTLFCGERQTLSVLP
jgi:hypothetical protein